MAWRRNAGRRTRSLSFRRRPRVHEPKKSGHWQRANFALAPINSVDGPNQQEFTTLILAQIFRNLADGATAAGENFTNQVKYLEIGGMVFDWQFMPTMQRGTTLFGENLHAFAQVIIFSDRIDSDGNPAAPDANWFNNTTPVGVATAVEGQDEDHKYPTRVHYRHAVGLDFDETVFSAGANGGDGTTAAVHQIRTQGSKSLKLRLRLDDEHALCVCFHLATDNQYPTTSISIDCKMMFVGSLYYRVVF